MTAAELQAALASGKYKVREGKIIIPAPPVEQKSSRKEEDDVVAPWPRAERPPTPTPDPAPPSTPMPCAWWKHPWAWAVFFVAGMLAVLLLAGILA